MKCLQVEIKETTKRKSRVDSKKTSGDHIFSSTLLFKPQKYKLMDKYDKLLERKH